MLRSWVRRVKGLEELFIVKYLLVWVVYLEYRSFSFTVLTVKRWLLGFTLEFLDMGENKENWR